MPQARLGVPAELRQEVAVPNEREVYICGLCICTEGKALIELFITGFISITVLLFQTRHKNRFTIFSTRRIVVAFGIFHGSSFHRPPHMADSSMYFLHFSLQYNTWREIDKSGRI